MVDPCFPLFLLKNMHFHAMRGLCKFLVILDPIFLVIYHFSGSDTMNFLYRPRSIKVCEAKFDFTCKTGSTHCKDFYRPQCMFFVKG